MFVRLVLPVRRASHVVASGVTRRNAIISLSALFLAVLPAGAQSGTHTGHAASTADRASPTIAQADDPLVRRTADGTVLVSLTASPARLQLVPGTDTDVYAYNGQVPGPTLEFHEGDRVVVRFTNRLQEPTTVHWHGLHLPFVADGSPFHPVAPGESFDYEFTIREGTAGTYWYHPHPHHATSRQVAMGLYGAIVVRSADDPVPAGVRERLLVLSDNRLNEHGQVDFAEEGTVSWRIDRENGREGDRLFVSGELMPTYRVRAGEVERWRVVNASGARMYRLALTGHRLLHIGSDGGLFEAPVEVDEVLIGNGERVELLVQATGEPGSSARLVALPYDRYIRQTQPADWDVTRELARIEYSPEARVPSPALPRSYRAVPPLDTAVVRQTHVVVLTQALLNGRAMDMDRVDVRVNVGDTDIWEIENLVGMDHPFHLHGFRFQVLERDGVPETARTWKDVVNVPRHGSVRLVVRYNDFEGKWMFHCHILEHEDAGMMGVLEVARGNP